ncbi:MAG TPA: hydroxyacid dehydrogenase, partial [bacterium]|nr:hydroxyacid dehydrogenase [bacterium]
MKLLVADGIASEAQKILESIAGLECDIRKSIKADDLLKIIGDYDFLIVRSATKVTKEVIDYGKKLKIIGRAGAGVDNIDVKAATERGIYVENTPGGNSHAVAELVMGMMFALARKLNYADASMRAGKWEKKAFEGTELKDKTLGIIGLGRIGSDLAKMAKAIGMKVIGYDPILTDESFKEYGVTKVELDELYAKSDYISLHVPANDKTKNMINASTIAKMKNGVRIINCARGGIVNEADLKAALESGKVAGAGVDVFSVEPCQPDNPLLSAPNTILTPHIGASTEEAQDNVGVMIANQIKAYIEKKEIINAVNK